MRRNLIKLAVLVMVLSVAVIGTALAYGYTQAPFGEGALDFEGQVPSASQFNSIWFFNDGARIRMTSGDSIGKLLARTNGAGDNGVGQHAFTYQNQTWQNNVPFGIGDYKSYHFSGDRLYTPRFNSGSVKLFNSAGFIEGNDVSVTVDGVIYRAFNDELGRVRITQNGTLLGRSNGAGDNGKVLALSVVKVRTGYTLDANGKIVNVYETVPFVQVEYTSYHTGTVVRVMTPRNNAGSVKLLDIAFTFPK
jgi:hypothetical protein